MKISLLTLTALMYSGDRNATEAHKSWLSMEDRKPSNMKIECHTINNNNNFVLLLVKQ